MYYDFDDKCWYLRDKRALEGWTIFHYYHDRNHTLVLMIRHPDYEDDRFVYAPFFKLEESKS